MTILRNIKVPMRDGVRLSTTVHLPPGEGPFPVALMRTAYNRTSAQGAGYNGRGLALVTQDCRGRYDSEGTHYPFTAEEADGADTLAWLRDQPWCNGRVAMFGDSYLAATQFYAALANDEALVAINPRFMAGDCWKRAYYCDGVFSLALTWSWLCFECAARTSENALLGQIDAPAVLRSLPLASLDEESGGSRVQSWRDYVTHTRYDEQWRPLNVRARLAEVTVPALLIGGWYDYYAGETFANYLALRRGAPMPRLRDSHRVLVGPWTHGINSSSVLGEVDFGEVALAENDATMRWLECTLADCPVSEFQEAPIRVFVMGRNEWRDLLAWPPAEVEFVDWYLLADGGLSPEQPGDEAPDGYRYDPADPAPTLGGNHSVGPYNPGLYEVCRPGPFDQRPVEARADVLSFTSDVLERDVEVIGPVTVALHAASSSPDTDFVARLTDVHPDGRSMNITEGVIRARFREDVWGAPKLMEPGRAYEFTIDLQATAHAFLRGHRIRLDITSSNFPLWDRNLNTGGDPATDTAMAVAEQIIFHDRRRPSRVRLPVMPACLSRGR